MKSKIKRLIIIIGVSLVACIAVVAWDFYSYMDKPAAPGKTESVITIESGQNLFAISEALYKAGIIISPLKFELLVRVKKYGKKIQAGEYLLSSAMSPNTILDMLVNGRVILHKLTIPEGYNLTQIAFAVEEAGLGTGRTFLSAAEDQSLLRAENIEAQHLEGYLFPDTYHFPKKVLPETIISTMVKRFRSVFTSDWEKQAEDLGFSVHQIVTLASMIEKETGDPAERPVISSVFHNRLEKKMRLESDPTVIYGIEDFDGNITREHLSTYTPYNTYVISGLPPGPIANPGKESLEAALFPAETDYLYFVSKQDTTHQFSTNFEDHDKAVRKYQILKRRD